MLEACWLISTCSFLWFLPACGWMWGRVVSLKWSSTTLMCRVLISLASRFHLPTHAHAHTERRREKKDHFHVSNLCFIMYSSGTRVVNSRTVTHWHTYYGQNVVNKICSNDGQKWLRHMSSHLCIATCSNWYNAALQHEWCRVQTPSLRCVQTQSLFLSHTHTNEPISQENGWKIQSVVFCDFYLMTCISSTLWVSGKGVTTQYIMIHVLFRWRSKCNICISLTCPTVHPRCLT